jgi:hypothetical protein
MKVKPILAVMDNTIYTVLAPAGDERYNPLTTQMIGVCELVYDLSDETYIKHRGDKTLGDDTIKNLFKMSKPVSFDDFNYFANQAFPRKEWDV